MATNSTNIPIHYYHFIVRTNIIKYNNQQKQKREKEKEREEEGVLVLLSFVCFPLDDTLLIAPDIHGHHRTLTNIQFIIVVSLYVPNIIIYNNQQ